MLWFWYILYYTHLKPRRNVQNLLVVWKEIAPPPTHFHPVYTGEAIFLKVNEWQQHDFTNTNLENKAKPIRSIAGRETRFTLRQNAKTEQRGCSVLWQSVFDGLCVKRVGKPTFIKIIKFCHNLMKISLLIKAKYEHYKKLVFRPFSYVNRVLNVLNFRRNYRKQLTAADCQGFCETLAFATTVTIHRRGLSKSSSKPTLSQ